jgi:hypothetical protein
MSKDYIPRPDAGFHVGRNNFVTCVNGYLAHSGLAAGDVVDLDNTAATWRTDYRARKWTTASGPRTIVRP